MYFISTLTKCAFFVGCLAGFSDAAKDDEAIRRCCEKFVIKLKRYLPVSIEGSPQVSSLQSGECSVSFDYANFVVDSQLGYVRVFEAFRPQNAHIQTQRVALQNEKDVLKLASEVVSIAGFRGRKWYPTRVEITNEVPGSSRSNKAFVLMEERPYGYRTFGLGNSVSTTFDRRDGMLLHWRESRGWTYAEPKVIIAEAKARASALMSLQEAPSAVATLSGRPLLQFVEAKPADPKSRILRLCYGFKFDGGSVFVDVQSGKVVQTVRWAKRNK